MHKLSTSFVLGYHGCHADVGEAILNGELFRPSENEYDWLGWGVYFWEANPTRAMEFAEELRSRWEAKHQKPYSPMVVGAVIDLGYCLDLMATSGLGALGAVYESFRDVISKAGVAMPSNRIGEDLLRRDLDCAVINHLHTAHEQAEMRPLETVRGVFVEGQPVYPNAGFREKTHIQICVRNLECIKGVFRVHGLSTPTSRPAKPDNPDT